jgi:hypothetical protein
MSTNNTIVDAGVLSVPTNRKASRPLQLLTRTQEDVPAADQQRKRARTRTMNRNASGNPDAG